MIKMKQMLEDYLGKWDKLEDMTIGSNRLSAGTALVSVAGVFTQNWYLAGAGFAASVGFGYATLKLYRKALKHKEMAGKIRDMIYSQSDNQND